MKKSILLLILFGLILFSGCSSNSVSGSEEEKELIELRFKDLIQMLYSGDIKGAYGENQYNKFNSDELNEILSSHKETIESVFPEYIKSLNKEDIKITEIILNKEICEELEKSCDSDYIVANGGYMFDIKKINNEFYLFYN